MGVLTNKIKREDLKRGDHIYSYRLAYTYSHHGIYVDAGNVIHFLRGEGQEIGTGTALDNIIGSSLPHHPLDNPCPICGDESRRDGVISSCIDCFLSGGDLYRYEYGVTRTFFLAKVRGGTCTLASSESPEQVIHRAFYFLRKGFGDYDVIKNNCEDFALCCKTGLRVIPTVSMGQSGQAASFQAAAGIIISSSLVFLARSSPLGFLATNVTGLAGGYGKYCVNRLANDIGVRRDVMKVVLEEET
ncbi:protein LEAD-SENSITIVE 1-like [Quercus robur]|uniref:protein LEAD-SENSITIVE 1-like n=1 Tax=Quercus robur TaxID=38942 RepID=UPI002162CD8D|nr:protein LEAD-SENSITIVE 1-like [Quercus robur]